MKDAWDRLRQCISSANSASHCGSNTLPILNQVYHFVCGNLIHCQSSSPTLPGGQMCSLVDPKAITFAILQQQLRAEVIKQSHSSLTRHCKYYHSSLTLASIITMFVSLGFFVNIMSEFILIHMYV